MHRILTLGLVACFLAGCASSVATSSQETDTVALEALYWARLNSAKQNFTEAEAAFMTGMIGHHAQALIMARMAPEQASDSQVRTLAARIINAQNDEIAAMQRWLRDRDQTVPEVHIDGTHLMIHGAGEHTMMPGMLSAEQLEELASSSGADFDRLFLTYMIQHHQGAVAMVDDLFNRDQSVQDEAAFKLSSDIHVDQITEIARMRRMLDSLFPTTQDR